MLLLAIPSAMLATGLALLAAVHVSDARYAFAKRHTGIARDRIGDAFACFTAAATLAGVTCYLASIA